MKDSHALLDDTGKEVAMNAFTGAIIEAATKPTDFNKVSSLQFMKCKNVYFIDKLPILTGLQVEKVMELDFYNDFEGLLKFGKNVHYARDYKGGFARDLETSKAYLCDHPAAYSWSDLIVTSADEVFKVAEGYHEN